MIVTNVNEVKQLYVKANQNRWVLPCFCSENLTTTEAILAATMEYGKKTGRSHLPIIIAITCNYDHRAQAPNYTHTRDSETGMRLFLRDIQSLAGPGCIFEDLQVMIHLDHIQFDRDEALLQSDLRDFSSIMFDASALPFEENIKLTAAFVKRCGNEILIEGACDEIMDATGNVHNALTTPANALRYAQETEVDLIVANLGTEHRATGKELQYHGEVARAIKEKIGTSIVLHGTSSVSNEQVKKLFDDGICKVNIWTALERDATPVLFEDMVRNASKIADADTIKLLIAEGFLTERCLTGEKPSIQMFTTVYRQDLIFAEMKKMVMEYLQMWYI